MKSLPASRPPLRPKTMMQFERHAVASFWLVHSLDDQTASVINQLPRRMSNASSFCCIIQHVFASATAGFKTPQNMESIA